MKRFPITILVLVLWSLPSTAASSCRDAWREPLRGAVLRIAHYPTDHALRAYLDLSSVPRPAPLALASLHVHRRADGEEVAKVGVDPVVASAPGGLETILSLPTLGPGEWELRTRLATRDCADIPGPVARFAVSRFGWEGNLLGNDPAVIPPFTPLEIEGNRIRVVLRDHSLAPTGLWNQVTSEGRPLLRRPMRWVVGANGVAQQIRATPIEVRATAPERIALASRIEAGPLSIQVEGAFEIDGLYRVRASIEGDPRTRIDRLDLVIPIAEPYGRLMNAITDETRIHHLGAVPEGQDVVWRSRDAPRRQLDAGFLPYIWVGDEERGIAWLAESTRDFLFQPGTSVVELRRQAGVLELVIHFASAPGPLERDRRIEFALQATPVKPRPDHAGSWRLWQLACDAGPTFVSICPLPSGFYWGTASPYGDVTPRDEGKSVFRWMADARAGRQPTPAIGEWLDRNGVRPAERANAVASLEYAMRVLAIPTQATVVYMDAQGSAWGPEFAAYADEWRPAPFGDREGFDEPNDRTLPAIPRQSYRDRLLWHLDRLLAANAADGVFFDNTFLRASFDDRIGTAYRDEQGALHPGVEIFALRDLFKRAQTLVWKRRGGWWNVIHLTTTPISAIHGFAGMSLDGEWKYGTDDFQTRFSRDYLRASALGSQLGTVPLWLPGMLSVTGPKRDELQRQLFGLTALHEIRVLDSLTGPLGDWWRRLREQGYGDPSCVVGRYWDEDPIVRIVGVDAAALAVRCGNKITALVVGFDDGGTAELRVDSNPGRWKCRDLDRRWERFMPGANGCQLQIGRHAVRLIEMTK